MLLGTPLASIGSETQLSNGGARSDSRSHFRSLGNRHAQPAVGGAAAKEAGQATTAKEPDSPDLLQSLSESLNTASARLRSWGADLLQPAQPLPPAAPAASSTAADASQHKDRVDHFDSAGSQMHI